MARHPSAVSADSACTTGVDSHLRRTHAAAESWRIAEAWCASPAVRPGRSM